MNRLIDEKEPVFLGEFMWKMFCRNQMQTFFQPFSQQANRNEMIGHGVYKWQLTLHVWMGIWPKQKTPTTTKTLEAPEHGALGRLSLPTRNRKKQNHMEPVPWDDDVTGLANPCVLKFPSADQNTQNYKNNCLTNSLTFFWDDILRCHASNITSLQPSSRILGCIVWKKVGRGLDVCFWLPWCWWFIVFWGWLQGPSEGLPKNRSATIIMYQRYKPCCVPRLHRPKGLNRRQTWPPSNGFQPGFYTLPNKPLT